MFTLKESHRNVWVSIQNKLKEAINTGALEVERFHFLRRQNTFAHQEPTLFVLDRRVSSEDLGTNRSLASVEITFGVNETSFQQTDQDKLESLVFDVANLFLEDPTLGGLTEDTALVALEPDAQPFPEEATEMWATATLRWSFAYLRV